MTGVHRDKIVIITGASSGIGYATARAFAARGSKVVAVARREDNLRRLLRECEADSPESSYLCGDLGEHDFAERVIAATIERYGRIDVLINNAAVAKHKLIYDISADEAEQVVRINFLATLWTTLAVIPHMLRQEEGGTIVNISSFAAQVAPPREAVYAASKAAMSRFSEGLWHDLSGSNIHVAVLHPGAIDTEIWEKLDQPGAYAGRKHPPKIVVDAIFEAIEKRRFEITVPKHNLQLMLARTLRLLHPALLRRAMKRVFPVPPAAIASARIRARARQP